MKLAMLTAKHHDGFCLWPTTTTPHSVKNSPWKEGKGDVLGELVKAAGKKGIKIGVYLSPADLSEIERPGGTYGNGSESRLVKIPSDPELQKSAKQVFEYELDDYNALFMNQLYEVLTWYGEITEVWFDGANPKPGTGQTYNRKAWYDMIKKLQPGTVIAIKGPDVRWCGNEAGRTRKSEWSVLPVPVNPEYYDWPDLRKEDLGSREKLKDAKYLYWYPAETNTSIRHGWFYRDEEQYVKTVEELTDTWYRSVGGNTVFLLNLTPDRRGLIPEKDAERLRKTGDIIARSFEVDLTTNASVESSDAVRTADNILDGNPETYWKPSNGSSQPELVINLDGEKEFNRLVLQEAIKTQGQRIENFTFDIWKDNSWQEITNGTVVGYKNIRRFPMVKAAKVRVRILESRLAPTLSVAGLYKAPEILSNPEITRNREGIVTIQCKTPDPEIRYTVDGSKPDKNSVLYRQPFKFDKGGVVRALSMINNGTEVSETVSTNFDIAKVKWTVKSTSSEHPGFEGIKAIDENPRTFWHTGREKKAPSNSQYIEINLGETLSLKGVSYLPRTDGKAGGICRQYKIELSLNGKDWTLAKKGVFDNIKNDPILRKVYFQDYREARYIRFTGLSTVNNDKALSVAELGIITRQKVNK